MISTFDFRKHTLALPLKTYKVFYPNEANGWQAGIYNPRDKVKKEFKPTFCENGFEIQTTDWYEIGASLNGDFKTCPQYHYVETTHFQVVVQNANYLVNIKLYNPEKVERTIDIYINNILETTTAVSACTFKEINLKIALSKDVFDLYFANHNASDEKSSAIKWKIDFLSFSLEKEPIKTVDKKIGIYVASDSTAQSYSLQEEPQSGWGQELYHQIKGKEVIITNSSFYPQATKYSLEKCFIDNRSMGARSSKTFITEGRLESILKSIKPNDYLLIQFGDNDSTAIRPNRYVPVEKFAYFIKQYIESAKSRKAIPILVSPPSQFKFDSEANKFVSTFEEYRNVMKKLSKEYDIPLIELGHEVTRLLNKLGFEAAHAVYLQVNKEDYPNLDISKRDITHFQHYGAFKLAQIVASNLKTIIKSDQFITRDFKKDLRPVLDQRLQRVHLIWNHVDNSDFNVIEIHVDGSWKYLAVTTKDDIYAKFLNGQISKYRILSYDANGNIVKKHDISLV